MPLSVCRYDSVERLSVFQVFDGDRVFQFEGTLLAHASSYRADSERWVEFDIYRTPAGAYIISRVGYSVLYHDKSCQVVRRGRHEPAQVATLSSDSRPCELCAPKTSLEDPNHMIYPEKPIYWAQVCNSPEAAVSALAKYDTDGNRYFTHVARRLIGEAAKVDEGIKLSYYIETIA